MKRIILILLAITMQASPVMAWQRVGNAFVLDKDDVEMCAKGQGCRVVHDDVVDMQIAQVRREAYLAGVKHGAQAANESCKGSI